MAYILAGMLAYLIAQPAVDAGRSVSGMKCRAMQGCSRMHCAKTEKSDKKNGKCDSNDCNPFMACAAGNFYLTEKFFIGYTPAFTTTERIGALNDNRTFSSLSDCWHPPEIVWLTTTKQFDSPIQTI